jgi:hypothetical protein
MCPRYRPIFFGYKPLTELFRRRDGSKKAVVFPLRSKVSYARPRVHNPFGLGTLRTKTMIALANSNVRKQVDEIGLPMRIRFSE